MELAGALQVVPEAGDGAELVVEVAERSALPAAAGQGDRLGLQGGRPVLLALQGELGYPA